MPRVKLTAEERKARGSRPKADAPHEKSVVVKPPEPPANLTKAEQAVWAEMIDPLIVRQQVSSEDLFQILALIDLVMKITETRAYLRKHGDWIQISNSSKKLRPEYKLLESLEKRLDKYVDKFGLCPRARKQLNIKLVFSEQPDSKKAADKKSAILKPH